MLTSLPYSYYTTHTHVVCVCSSVLWFPDCYVIFSVLLRICPNISEGVAYLFF